MDPLILYLVAAALAVILLTGALDKLRHFSVFEGAVLAYRLIPGSISKVFAGAFVTAELAAALLLLLPHWRTEGAWLALGVLGVATAGVVVNLGRGHTDVACGCGNLKQQSAGLSWWLVGRNAVLLLALSVLFLPRTAFIERSFGWVDGLTFFGAALALLGLYFAANQLIESHIKLQKLKEI